ncbi:hypothetical protein [Sessilibacter sp. MAH4]
MTKIQKSKKPVIALLCLSSSAITLADEGSLMPGNIAFHGFATQNFVHSSDNQFFGDSESGSFEFFEVGGNALWKINESLSFSAQLVARDAGKTDDGDPRFDYAFLDYQYFKNDWTSAGFRVGRVVQASGLYNETRDVAATRPSIILPQSVYFDTLRNLALSSDGISFYNDFFRGQHELSTQLVISEPRAEDPDLEPTVFSQARPGRFDGSASWIGRILYDYDFGRLKFGITAAELDIAYKERGDPVLSNGEFSFRPIILSAQYQSEKITYAAEYIRRKSYLKGFGSAVNNEVTGSSYYLQVQYRLNNQFSFFTRFDNLIRDDKDIKGEKFAEVTGFEATTRFSKDFAVGARWDINNTWLVSAEYHNIEGAGWLSLLENPDHDVQKFWNLYLMSVSARF